MKEEPAEVKEEPTDVKEEPTDVKEERIDVKEDPRDWFPDDVQEMEFIFMGLECVGKKSVQSVEPSDVDMKSDIQDQNQCGEPSTEDTRSDMDQQLAAAYRLLQETSYLSDTEYDDPLPSQKVLQPQKEEQSPEVIEIDSDEEMTSNDALKPDPSCAPDGSTEEPMTRSSEKEKFVCIWCGKTCRTLFLLTEHRKYHEDRRPFKCNICDKSFSRKVVLVRHRRCHFPAMQDPSNQIKSSFGLQEGNQSKLESKGSKNNSPAEISQVLPMKNSHADNYTNAHEHIDASQGEISTTGSGHEYSVVNIEHRQTQKVLFVCKICKKAFLEKESLFKHMRSHVGKGPFTCSICDKKFAKKVSLNLHHRIHTRGRPCPCTVCGKEFVSQCALKLHQKVHVAHCFQASVQGMMQKEMQGSEKVVSADLQMYTSTPVHMEVPYGKTAAAASGSQHGCNVNIKNMQTQKILFVCKICKKAFSKNESLFKHMRRHLEKGPFICRICDKKFAKKISLNIHHRIHIRERPYSSSVCGEEFVSRSALNIRQNIHGDAALFQCSVCGKTFTQHDTLTEHCRSHSKKTRFSCVYCRKKFRSNCNLKRHYLTHSEERPFMCGTCGKAFKRKDYLKAHKCIQKLFFSCNVCSKRFKDEDSLKKHSVIHADTPDTNTFACSVCGNLYKNINHLLKHRATHTQVDLLSRRESQSQTHTLPQTYTYLQTHSYTHSLPHTYPYPQKFPKIGKKLVTCIYCDKRLKNADHLKEHCLIHAAERPFLCSVCGIMFKKSEHLKKHFTTHTVHPQTYLQTEMETYPETYSQTYLIANSKSHAQTHLQTHLVTPPHIHSLSKTVEIPFTCKYCGKVFENMDSMKKHCLIHADERSLVPSAWGEMYRTSRDLKTQSSTRSHNKRTPCTICGKVLSSKAYLTEHMRVHTGERPYSCNLCTCRYHFKVNLNMHIKKNHCNEKMTKHLN